MTKYNTAWDAWERQVDEKIEKLWSEYVLMKKLKSQIRDRTVILDNKRKAIL